jgi:hypothetical protein
MAPLDLEAGATLADTERLRLWRVRRGVLVVCQHGPGLGERPQYLALPGDLIGLEQCVGAAPPSRVLALAAATLVALPSGGAVPSPVLLGQALAQARRQADELQRLRAGLLSERLLRLLALLRQPGAPDGDVAMPTLKQLSRLLEATPEAICRTLTQMKQADVIVAQASAAPLARPRVRVALPVAGSQAPRAGGAWARSPVQP